MFSMFKIVKTTLVVVPLLTVVGKPSLVIRTIAQMQAETMKVIDTDWGNPRPVGSNFFKLLKSKKTK